MERSRSNSDRVRRTRFPTTADLILAAAALAHLVFVVCFSGRVGERAPLTSFADVGGLALFASLGWMASRWRPRRSTLPIPLVTWGVTWLCAVAMVRPGIGPGGLLRRLLLLHGPGGPAGDSLLGSGIGFVPAALAVVSGLLAARSERLRRTIGGGTSFAAYVPMFALLGAPAAELIRRQYREQFVLTARGTRVSGSLTPILVWSGLLALGLSLALTALLAPATRHRITQRAVLLGIAGGAFVWRVAALLTLAPARTDGGDPLYYHTQANGLVKGRGFIEPLNWIAHGKSIPTALHGPGYPTYLSIFSRIGADTFFDHRMASSLIGACTVLLAGIIANRLAGPTAAALAAVLAAVYPNLWTIDGVLFPEGLFVFCCGLATLFAFRWHDHRRAADAALLGVCIGAAALTRGEGVFLVVLLAGVLMIRRGSGALRRRLVPLAVTAAATLTVMAPWMIRNAVTFERFVPLSTNGSELHVYSNCAATYNGRLLGFWSFACQQRLRDPDGDGTVDFEPAGDESETSAAWQAIGFDYAKAHTSRLPVVLAARLGRQWEVFRPLQNTEFAPIEGRRTDIARLALAMYYPMVGLSMLGALRLRRRGIPLTPLIAHFAAVSLTALYAYGTIRFRAPAELALCILTGIGAAPLVRRVVGALRHDDSSRPASADTSAWVLGERMDPNASHASRRVRVATQAAVIAAVALPLRGLYRTPGSTMEEGFMLTFPERVLKGATPNVDFLHLYGPGSLHALAGIYRLFGTNLTVERTFGLGQHLLILSALYCLTRAWGHVAAAIATLAGVTLVLTPIGLSALAWNGAIGLGLWSLVFALRVGPSTRTARWLGCAGLAAGLALSFRPDIVIALLLAHGYLLWRRPRREWYRLAGFAALGLLPMWVHLVVAGPVAVIRGIVIEPVFRLRGGRTLPAPPSWDHLDGALQVIADKIPPWWGLPAPTAAQQLVMWFFLTPVVAVLPVITAWRVRQRNPASVSAPVLGTAGLFGLGILQQAFQRPDSAHFAWVSMVTVPLLIPSVIEWRAIRKPSSNRAARTMWAFGAVAALLVAVMPFFTLRLYTLHVRQTIGQLPPGLRVDRGDRFFYLGDAPPWKAAQAATDDLDRLSRPGDRLLVGPVDLRQTAYSDAFFYHLFPELTPATKYIEMDPGMANAEDSGLADEVRSADWLILTRFWSGWIEPNDSIVFGPDAPNQAVEEGFCLIGSYEHDLARLYQRCDGGGAPGPYEGPYEPTRDPAVEVRVPVPRRPDGTCTTTCAN